MFSHNFLTNFTKMKVLSANKLISKFEKINFSFIENHLLKNLLSVGAIAHEIVKNTRKDDKTLCELLNKSISMYSNRCYFWGPKITAEQWFSQNSGCNWSYGSISKEHCCIKSYLFSAWGCHKCFVINRPTWKLWKEMQKKYGWSNFSTSNCW